MMKLTFLLLALISTNLYAKECVVKAKKKDLKLTWTAYKTPLKAGVNGTFDDLGVKKDFSSKKATQLLIGAKFNIKTKSINTNNPDRDKKIAKFFFSNAPVISGEILDYKRKILNVSIKMNGVTRTVPMKLTTSGQKLEATGIIDVFDYNLNDALSAINKACLKLHEGKTWSDVSLKLELSYTKTCK